MKHERRPVRRWPLMESEEDAIAVEEPLEIRVEGKSIAITMRTPGDDLDLAAGFLLSEGVIDGADDLIALSHVEPSVDPNQNTVNAILAGGVAAHAEGLAKATRELYATSSCGLCGKASIDRLTLHYSPLLPTFVADPQILLQLPSAVVHAQAAFAQTGALHAAALFSPSGALEVLREDIGRHNAVDKVLGWRLRQDRVPVDDRILLVTSRAGFEVVQKARAAGISTVCAMGAATSLAVSLAAESNLSLFGFLRADRFTQYT